MPGYIRSGGFGEKIDLNPLIKNRGKKGFNEES
jgi:hypothetical protein